MKQINKLFFLLIILSLSINVFANNIGLSIEQISYNPLPAKTGQNMELYVSVKNNSNLNINNITCEIESVYPFYLWPDENQTRTINLLNMGQNALFKYRFRVDEKAFADEYEIDFKCKQENSLFVSRKLLITIDSERPDFAIGQILTNPNKLLSDSIENKIDIEIQNIGDGLAKLITTKLILPEGFSSSNSYSNISNLGMMNKNESKTATYLIDIDKNVNPGKHYGKVLINYKFENNQDEYIQKKLDFEFDVKDEPKLKINDFVLSSNDGLRQGEKSELKLIIENYGNKEANEVSIRIFKQTDQPFDFDKQYDYIGKISPNEFGEAIISFDVQDDALLKDYFIKLEIRYLTENIVKISEDQIKITINKERPKDNTIIFIIGAAILVIVGAIIWKKVLKK
jgi:hypothetical protein